ncbi:taurine dioxygenase [Sphingobium faniae]|nr:taurine dioxygenase [Sphingobium faniae]
MVIDWTPVTATFGAEVRGLDLDATLSEEQRRALSELWRDRGLLLFRDAPLTPEAQVALTEVFGAAEIHPAREAWVEGFPQLTHIRFTPEQRERTTIYDVNGAELANWQPWHIDTIYTTKVDRGGILHAVEVPSKGADTGFIDRAMLYDLMPDALRERAEGKRVLYRLNPIASANPFYPPGAARLIHRPPHIEALQARIASDFPIVSHPVFFIHPDSGRRTLNVTAMHAIGMENMDPVEGDALLRELVLFSLTTGERYFHHWRGHDTVIWDNWRFLHSAEGTPTHITRRLRRSGVIGDYGEGRTVTQAHAAEKVMAMP